MRLRVSDVMLSGEMRDKVRVQPMKTKRQAGSAVVFESSRDTQKLLVKFIEAEDLLSTDFLFTSARPLSWPVKPLSERAYLTSTR